MGTFDINTLYIVLAIVGVGVGATWIIGNRIGRIETSLARLDERLNGHPSWSQIQSEIARVLSEHEFHYHHKDRREPTRHDNEG